MDLWQRPSVSERTSGRLRDDVVYIYLAVVRIRRTSELQAAFRARCCDWVLVVVSLKRKLKVAEADEL